MQVVLTLLRFFPFVVPILSFRVDGSSDPIQTNPFFNTDTWVENEPCYKEFMSIKDKSEWSACCEENPSSLNCEEYHPEDVCYEFIQLGPEAVDAGGLKPYPNAQWEDCCDLACDAIHWECSYSSYCQSIQQDLLNYWDEYFWIAISLMILLLVIVILCCCACILGIMLCCNKSMRGAEMGSPLMVYDEPITPQVVYFDQSTPFVKQRIPNFGVGVTNGHQYNGGI